jgi:hypothetical protein
VKHPGPGFSGEEQEIGLAFGRMVGFVLAAFLLLVGGGIGLILLGAVFFRFLGGG